MNRSAKGFAGRRLAATRARAGFSLLEVLLALAILTFGSVAVLVLFMNSLRTIRQAQEESILALLEQDLKGKCQLSAYFAFDAANPRRGTFDGSVWLPRDPAAPDDPGAPPWEPDSEPPRVDAYLNQDWTVVRAAYDALAGEGLTWSQNPLYVGYQYRLRTVLPAWRESNQLVDFDGYGWIGEDETDADLDGDGRTGEAGTGRDFGPPRPSHGVVYDPRGLRFYLKHLECVVGWDLQDPRDIFSGQYHVFRFTVYNPDARKDR